MHNADERQMGAESAPKMPSKRKIVDNEASPGAEAKILRLDRGIKRATACVPKNSNEQEFPEKNLSSKHEAACAKTQLISEKMTTSDSVQKRYTSYLKKTNWKPCFFTSPIKLHL